jgi:hypothetical protein
LIYLDSSAIVKLIRREPRSATLHEFLSRDDTPPLFTSQLAITEVKRALHATGAADVAAGVATARPPALLVPGHRVLALPITAEVALAAGDLLSGTALRSLDAIHLATASEAGAALTAVVTYDKRMIDAAASAGLPVTTPAGTAGG